MKVDLTVAKNNWKNFFRGMIGLPKSYEVKIVRNEKAKQYPMLQIKKAGDVGYDLPCTEDIIVPASSEEQIAEYERYMRIANKAFTRGEQKRGEECQRRALKHLSRTVVPTGVKLEMPNNIWCTLEARSSTSKRMLITPDSIIDAGYRGELFGVVFNLGHEDLHVKAGDRLVQVIFHETVLADFKEVDKLSESERGESGFGSTGN